MKVILGNLPMGDVPEAKRKAGEFFPRLVALRVLTTSDGNWLDYEPVYIPVVRVQRRAGQVIIEINSDRPLAYLTLQARKPFINLFRFPWREWDSGDL